MHDWSAWRTYRLVKDAGGMIELLVDNDPVPVVSYPYDLLGMGTLGGPAIMFGNLNDGANSRVTFEFDYLNYSVGMPNTDGCTSSDGKMQLLSLINMTRVFDPTYEGNDVVGRLKIATVEGLSSNTQGHKFFLRASRDIRDGAGNVIRVTRDDVQIGPLGKGKNPSNMIAEGLSSWNGMDSQGLRVVDSVYTYLTTFSLVRVDKKGQEKLLSVISAVGSPVLLTSTPSVRVHNKVNATKYYFYYDWVPTGEIGRFRNYSVGLCSTGSDPILDVYYENVGGTNPYSKVASNDNTYICGCIYTAGRCVPTCSTGSYVTVTPIRSGWILVLVRAKAADKGGACSLERGVQGANWGRLATNFTFAGTRVDWGWDAGDEIQNNILSEGQDTWMIQASTQNFAVLPNWWGYPAYDDNSGIGNASKLIMATAQPTGSTFVGQKPFATAGHVNVYRNDALLRDADGDGIGDLLEIQIGTCKTNAGMNKYGFDCSKSLENGKDTDGDGLRDYWEVFGVPHALNEPKSYDLNLPALGSNPLYKDVFIEVDFWAHPGQYDHRVRPQVIQAINTFFKKQPIANPNLQQGINVTVMNDGSTGCDADICPGSPTSVKSLCLPTSTCQQHLCERLGLGTGNDSDIGFLSSGFGVGRPYPGYVPGAVDWNLNRAFEDSCVSNPTAGGVQRNLDDVPALTKLNDCDDFGFIADNMARSLYPDQGSRFDGNYMRVVLPIQQPETVTCFE